MRDIRFETVDVFTDRRFAGNQLAVMTDARGLGDDEMQAIAREFGWPEVTFVLPPEDPLNDARVRIFTPTMEVPFAGHPNVGTAFVLARHGTLFGRPLGDRMLFEEKAGLVTVTITRDGETVTGAAIAAPQPLTVGQTYAPAVIAGCIGLDAADIETRNHPPVAVSVGLGFAVAELRDLAALGRARPNLARFEAAEQAHARLVGGFSMMVYVRCDESGERLRSRMFAPLDEIPEDPATGSASGALASFLAGMSGKSGGTHRIHFEQGVEMGRRSLITVDVTLDGGQAVAAVISGSCVPVMQGTISL